MLNVQHLNLKQLSCKALRAGRTIQCRSSAATEQSDPSKADILNWEPKIKTMEEWDQVQIEKNIKYDAWKKQKDLEKRIEESRAQMPEGRIKSDLEWDLEMEKRNQWHANPPPKVQALTLAEIFSMGGIELLAGRLAMVGWLCIVAGEALYDKNSWELVPLNEDYIMYNTIVWTLATIFPLQKGGWWWDRLEWGAFNRRVELIHARTCMIAIVGLYALEYLTGDCNFRFDLYNN